MGAVEDKNTNKQREYFLLNFTNMEYLTFAAKFGHYPPGSLTSDVLLKASTTSGSFTSKIVLNCPGVSGNVFWEFGNGNGNG